MKWYLGTNCGHGSSAAAITDDGVLAFAVEEGRLIGDKETSRFPVASVRLAITEMNSTPTSWGEGWAPLRRLLLKGVAATARYVIADPSYIGDRFWRETERMVSYLFGVMRVCRQTGVPRPTGHHVAHACSLLPWGLEPRTLVFVSDYIGEWSTNSVFYWDGLQMRLIRSTPFPHSLGAVFHQAATHLGFRGRQAPGNLMALAGHGRSRWVQMLDRLATVRDGRVVFDQKQLPLWLRRGAWRRFGEQNSHTEIGQAILTSAGDQERGADFAASVQEWFTDLTWRCVASNVTICRERYGLEVNHLALAGGCALNCQTNGVIVRRGPALGLNDVLVSPWSDDCGTAVGAAVMQSMRAGCRVFARATPFLGPRPSEDMEYRCRSDSLSAAINAICAGEIVALVSKRLEFGPRALGGRCLLASPLAGNIKRRLNLIKGRPLFMPFAPVVCQIGRAHV